MMRKLFATAASTAALSAGLAGIGTPAHATSGCVGFPDLGGIYYHCMTVDPGFLPAVSVDGETPVGTTVPAFCYFLGCTEPMPVGTTLPLELTTTRPAENVTVFEFRYYCYPHGCYGFYLRIVYDTSSGTCVFQSDHSTLQDLDGTSVSCLV